LEETSTATAGISRGVLGRPVTATDADQDDSLQYSLDPTASSPFFTIDSNTGVIRTVASAVFDYEMSGPSEYAVTVVATDNGTNTGINKLSAVQVVTIALKDMNEFPIMEDQERGISEIALNGQYLGGPLAAYDLDLNGGQKLMFSIKNTTENPDNLFAITNYGQVYLNRGPETGVLNPYLQYPDEYVLDVCVEDNGFSAPNVQDSLKTCKKLTITVLDANQPPVMISTKIFTLSENSIEGTTIGTPLAGTDPDDDALTYTISQGNEANLFTIDSQTRL
jgi:hypothetical protein